jgi:hypothetical protein
MWRTHFISIIPNSPRQGRQIVVVILVYIQVVVLRGGIVANLTYAQAR